jgi:hypothetical protein
MRVSLAGRAIAILAVISLAGCSSGPNFSSMWQRFSLKSHKSSPASASALASSAPQTAPSFNGNAPATTAPAAPPSVSMASAVQTSGAMPVYPGTTYPVTPYPATSVPTTVATTAPGYPTNPLDVAQNGAAPAGAAGAYPAYPVQGQAYAPPQSPVGPYAPPQGSYSAAAPGQAVTR